MSISLMRAKNTVYLWRQLRTLRGGHGSRVGALDWNNHILTTGVMDGLIINSDVRVESQIVETYRGHHQEVCGLKWSASCQQLASGGNDNLLHIWDRSTASSTSPTQWLHRLEDHTAAVKTLAWYPFKSNLLAYGGGDKCIKFWNTQTGVCLNSVDTGSQGGQIVQIKLCSKRRMAKMVILVPYFCCWTLLGVHR